MTNPYEVFLKNPYVEVTMTISHNIKPIKDKWHIKFDRDIVQVIQCPTFRFSSTSMNVAVTKVADLVARHPEHFFTEIIIK